jgi:hypothetical protein
MSASSKKETAKVSPAPSGSKSGLPQATVQMKKGPEASSGSKSVSASAISVAPQPAPAAQSGGEISPVIGAIALVISLAALAMQVWIWLAGS